MERLGGPRGSAQTGIGGIQKTGAVRTANVQTLRAAPGSTRRVKTRYIIATALYCAGIFWISSQPRPLGVEIPSVFGIDKFGHFGVYAGLAGLVSVGLQRSGSRLSPRWQFWFPIVFTAFYGLSDECHQIFVPQRTFAIGDLVANTAGGFAAPFFLWHFWWRPRRAGETPAK